MVFSFKGDQKMGQINKVQATQISLLKDSPPGHPASTAFLSLAWFWKKDSAQIE